ncbi:MAG: hypothetical protein HYY01_01225 [Chloroflexi bacterium]|nr:hypothetical protein [Chloroflexota bacterium]
MEPALPLGILALAFLSESITEYLFAGPLSGRGLGRYLPYVAAGVGVVLCLAYRIDLLESALGLSPGWPPLGQALTGLVLGRGSSYLHDFYTTFTKPKQSS